VVDLGLVEVDAGRSWRRRDRTMSLGWLMPKATGTCPGW
jgi:hypothetical protein